MRRGLTVLAFVPLCVGAGMVDAAAAPPPMVQGFSCAQASSSAPILCSGKIPSFDDVPLDADLTLPPGDIVPRPLIVMLHGYGSNKTEWESSTIASSSPNKNDYNTAAFAARGYAVLTYTARGFYGSCGQGPSTPGTTGHACDRGWTHLADRRFEVRDTQYLAGLLADAGVADPQRIAVTGGSYGGGQSLLLAMQGDTVATIPNPPAAATYDQATNQPWVSPKKHLAMHLAAAVPKYPWSDLIESLLPNGRASDGVILPDGDRINPAGVDKQSYVSYLFFSGTTAGYYCPAPCDDPSADLNGWFARVNAGEPYSPSDPTLAQALRELRDWKSSYYQDGLIDRTADRVPIFDIQGWTDNLFPEVEGVSLVNKLRAHGWPVKLAAADVGHPIGQNLAAIWSRLNSQANAFLDHYLLGAAAVPLDSSAQVTTCGGSTPGSLYTSPSSWADLAPYRVTFSSSENKATTSAVPGDSADPSTDPIAVAAQNGGNGACVIRPAGSSLATSSWNFPVTTPFTLLGAPWLHLGLQIVGTDAEINAKIWDVAGSSKTLVTRGAYRFSAVPQAGGMTIDTALQGNGWDFLPGHVLQLEVTQNDAPYLRADNIPSTISYSGVTLTLPTPTAPAATSTSGGTPTATTTVTVLAQTGRAPGPAPWLQTMVGLSLMLLGAAAGDRRRLPL